MALAAGIALAAALATGGWIASGQGGRTMWDGIYGEAQAARGKKAYIDGCAACHQEGLQGADLAPPLKGDDFVLRWTGHTMFDMVNTIATTMPSDSPGSLKPQDAADIVAYILQVNRVAAGKDDLPWDAAALKAIAITKPPGGP